MKVVGLKTLKNKLGEYVRAAAGETVLVTDGGRVVAELRPPDKIRSPILSDALLAQAVRKGWIAAPSAPRVDPPPSLPVGRWKEISKELTDDRRDR